MYYNDNWSVWVVWSFTPTAQGCCSLCPGCQQLQVVLLKLVRESFGDAQYRKAMDCLRCLRRECLAVGVHRPYLLCRDSPPAES
jgi:hypothetical protein